MILAQLSQRQVSILLAVENIYLQTVAYMVGSRPWEDGRCGAGYTRNVGGIGVQSPGLYLNLASNLSSMSHPTDFSNCY